MERLSTHQFTILGSSVLLGTTFFPVAYQVTSVAGRDGWMAILPGLSLGIPWGLMLLSLIPKYPNKNLVQISEKVLGKWMGKGFGLLYIFVTSYFGGLLLSQEVDVFTSTILPLMSHSVLALAGFALVFYLFYSGIEVLGRFSEVVFPLIALSLLMIAIFSIPRFEQGEIYPILADGIRPVISASTKIISIPMEYILFLAGLLPFLSNHPKDLKQMRKGIWRTILIVSFLLFVTVLVQIMTFGPYETVRMTYGLLVLGKMIEVSRTIAGVESLFILIWLGALAIKICAFFFAGVWGIQSVFGLKNQKRSFLLAGVYLANPIFVSRGTDLVVEIDKVGQYFILPLALIWVGVVWGVDKWKHRSKSS